ncbi:hypothetical protein [Parabacteroides johnsonii]|uniref:hypothetical protein n=1 Tax=Parabacteroides johnsonii TaxID=387661 RepID=UPI00243247F4|nr:hypothetical protein [Parabacteroides johnsonii]
MRMPKIMFNERYGLETSVLKGIKTVTRRICSVQPPYERNEIAFPVFAGDGEDSPLYGAFCWVNKDNPKELTKWCRTPYKWDDVVAIAQCYNDIPNIYSLVSIDELPLKSAGWRNKMFVKAKYMPNRIKINKVDIQRLQDISDEDCLKEGIRRYTKDGTVFKYDLADGFEMFCWKDMPRSPREAFAALIDKISGKGTWDKNPYVWRYEFELVKSEQS